jgi:hypothetical protein
MNANKSYRKNVVKAESRCKFVRHFRAAGAASFKNSGMKFGDWSGSELYKRDLGAALISQPQANFGMDIDSADGYFHEGGFSAC